MNIVHFQNAMSLAVSLYFYVALPYTRWVDPMFVNFNCNVVALHCLVDFPFAKKEVIFHHIIVFTFMFFMYSVNLSAYDLKSISNILCGTELSTLFYVIHIYGSENRQILFINDALFVITFFYFRIY